MFYLFANQTTVAKHFCWLIKLNRVVLSRVVYQFVFLTIHAAAFKLLTLHHEFYQNFLTLNSCHHLSMSLTFLKHIIKVVFN